MGLTKYLWSPLTSHTTTGLEATNSLFKILSHFPASRGLEIPTPSVSLQRPAAVTMAGIGPPAALHSYSLWSQSPWPQGLFSICGASAYTCTCPRGQKENVPWVTSCQASPGPRSSPVPHKGVHLQTRAWRTSVAPCASSSPPSIASPEW